MTGFSARAGCTNIDPNLRSPQCGSDVYFEDINAALNHWLANLYFG
jgi:hypothetical protein